MADQLLHVEGLHSGYAGGDILQGVSLTVAAGEIVAVVGRNGVGKTTLMRTVMGLLDARQGEIVFDGASLTRLGPQRRAELGIGYVPQGKQIFPGLTVRENLLLGERINGRRSVNYDLAFAYFDRLRERLDQRGGTLSGGEQQALAIARALVGTPTLLLLDEPSESIQPSIIQQIGDVLVRLNREQGLTIVFVEQNIGFIERVAQRGYVMDKGRTVAELDRDTLGDRTTMARYLAI